MPKIILHRGLYRGPDYSDENNPWHLSEMLGDYDCEIDLWRKNSNLYLGHDAPTYKISLDFLVNYRTKLWIHCKNISALEYMSKTCCSLNYFFHSRDDYTLTSQKFIWCHPRVKYVPKNGIQLDFSENPNYNGSCVGICVNYIKRKSQ